MTKIEEFDEKTTKTVDYHIFRVPLATDEKWLKQKT